MVEFKSSVNLEKLEYLKRELEDKSILVPTLHEVKEILFCKYGRRYTDSQASNYKQVIAKQKREQQVKQ